MKRTKFDDKTLKQFPTRWAVALVAVGLAYALVQPFISENWGLKLPSISALIGQIDPSTDSPVVEGASEPDSDRTSVATLQSEKSQQVAEQHQLPAAEAEAANNLHYGYLRELAPDDFVSPSGLRYKRGSEEGHRLKHLARHLGDQPERPGLHGVFSGDMEQVLKWLDDVYERGEDGAKGTRKRDEGVRTVYEVEFAMPVGYVGGRDGKRKGNPEARNIRLVTEGKRVITAFPF